MGSKLSSFPQTTNQDYHNGEVFKNSSSKGLNAGLYPYRDNNRKNTDFLGYVNATFNQGVYQSPKLTMY